MLGIFNDERRQLASPLSNPSRTGHILPAAASRVSCVGPTTLRHSLLTADKI